MLVRIIVKIGQEVVKIWIVFLLIQSISTDWEASVDNLNFLRGCLILAACHLKQMDGKIQMLTSFCLIFTIIHSRFSNPHDFTANLFLIKPLEGSWEHIASS